jgi:hypothetical protein
MADGCGPDLVGRFLKALSNASTINNCQCVIKGKTFSLNYFANDLAWE